MSTDSVCFCGQEILDFFYWIPLLSGAMSNYVPPI